MHLSEDRVRDEAMVGKDNAFAEAFIEGRPTVRSRVIVGQGRLTAGPGGGFR